MHSLVDRWNHLLAFTLYVMFAVAVACHLTSVFRNYDVHAELEVKDLRMKIMRDYFSDEFVEVVSFKFDLKVDLASVFNWNVKQLYLFMIVEYPTRQNRMNQVVVFHKIVQRDGDINVNDVSLWNQLPFVNDGTGLAKNNNITLSLRYEIMPNIGFLQMSKAKHTFDILSLAELQDDSPGIPKRFKRMYRPH